MTKHVGLACLVLVGIVLAGTFLLNTVRTEPSLSASSAAPKAIVGFGNLLNLPVVRKEAVVTKIRTVHLDVSGRIRVGKLPQRLSLFFPQMVDNG